MSIHRKRIFSVLVLFGIGLPHGVAGNAQAPPGGGGEGELPARRPVQSDQGEVSWIPKFDETGTSSKCLRVAPGFDFDQEHVPGLECTILFNLRVGNPIAVDVPAVRTQLLQKNPADELAVLTEVPVYCVLGDQPVCNATSVRSLVLPISEEEPFLSFCAELKVVGASGDLGNELEREAQLTAICNKTLSNDPDNPGYIWAE